MAALHTSLLVPAGYVTIGCAAVPTLVGNFAFMRIARGTILVTFKFHQISWTLIIIARSRLARSLGSSVSDRDFIAWGVGAEILETVAHPRHCRSVVDNSLASINRNLTRAPSCPSRRLMPLFASGGVAQTAPCVVSLRPGTCVKVVCSIPVPFSEQHDCVTHALEGILNPKALHGNCWADIPCA
eukprot:SAG11_NODE_1867_length_4152_cov_3.687886_1_plen_185_part_00